MRIAQRTPRGARRALPAVAVALLASVSIAACGGSGASLIPAADATPLEQDFEAVANAARSGHGSCAATEEAIEKTRRDFSKLPSGTGSRLRTTLEGGIRNLAERALAECSTSRTTSTSTSTTKTHTTSALTTQSLTTTSATPQTTTQQTASSTPEPPAPNGGTPAQQPNNGEGGEAGGEAPSAGGGRGAEGAGGGR